MHSISILFATVSDCRDETCPPVEPTQTWQQQEPSQASWAIMGTPSRNLEEGGCRPTFPSLPYFWSTTPPGNDTPWHPDPNSQPLSYFPRQSSSLTLPSNFSSQT